MNNSYNPTKIRMKMKKDRILFNLMAQWCSEQHARTKIKNMIDKRVSPLKVRAEVLKVMCGEFTNKSGRVRSVLPKYKNSPSPKRKTPSPKKKTPSPKRKSPRSSAYKKK